MTSQHVGHDHGDGSDHSHPGTHPDVELGYYARRAKAMELLLLEKGVVTHAEIQREINATESGSPTHGSRVVARAWVDPEFKTRLLSNAISAVAELGYQRDDRMPGLAAVENTSEIHHLVVCTLCSCYPRALLGRPPDWYKSLAYRSRAAAEPRGVMGEFGLELDQSVEVRVLDSAADMRYLVIPQRPAGTQGWSEDDLARLVTRDSMIGVTGASPPETLQ